MQDNYVKLLRSQARDLGERDGRSSISSSQPHTESHTVSGVLGHRLSLPWRTIGTQRYRRRQTAEPQQAKARLGLTADHIRARALRADVPARV